MNACEFSMSITALANAIAKNYDEAQVAVLSAAFTQLGDTLVTIAARQALCANRENPSPHAVRPENGPDANM